MPKVGGKHFTYDPAGIAAAREHSAKTGQPMSVPQRYMIGGLVDIGPSRGVPSKGHGKVMKNRVKNTENR